MTLEQLPSREEQCLVMVVPSNRDCGMADDAAAGRLGRITRRAEPCEATSRRFANEDSRSRTSMRERENAARPWVPAATNTAGEKKQSQRSENSDEPAYELILQCAESAENRSFPLASNQVHMAFLLVQQHGYPGELWQFGRRLCRITLTASGIWHLSTCPQLEGTGVRDNPRA